MKKLTNDEFIAKSKNIHGEKYNYSQVEYKTSHSKIKIICSIHGTFEQTANQHLNGSGCSKCSNNYKINTYDFIKQSKNIHKNTYFLKPACNGTLNIDFLYFDNFAVRRTKDQFILILKISFRITEKAEDKYCNRG